MIWLSIAFAQTDAPSPPPFEAPLVFQGPITEIDHPRYIDAAGTTLTWIELKQLAAPTDALRDVRRRRLGRTIVRTMFITASAAEIWGTWQLARNEHWTAYLLGGQATFTTLCAVLSFTSAPNDRVEDRAIVLRGANLTLGRR